MIGGCSAVASQFDTEKMMKNLLRWISAAVVLSGSFAVSAQYMWIDQTGQKVFSDRAPPADIPDSSILKRPDGWVRTEEAPPAQPATAALSKVDPKLEAKKKEADAAQAAKQKEEEAQEQKRRAENCKRARSNKKTLETGLSAARTNAEGELEFIDDKNRQAELARLQKIIDADCK